jgi:3-oxoacyl-[acyl-carrier protein] reductase
MAQDRPAALVTGSASGIGRAAALRLAQAGYDVAINYRRSEAAARQTLAEIESLGGRHLALRADVSDDEAVAVLVGEAGETFGPAPSRSPARPARRPWSALPARCPGCSPPRCGSTPSRRAGSRASGMQRTLGDDYERLMARRATWTPMRRNVTEQDVAETIFSLIASNPFVTGETIVIDGGYAATT